MLHQAYLYLDQWVGVVHIQVKGFNQCSLHQVVLELQVDRCSPKKNEYYSLIVTIELCLKAHLLEGCLRPSSFDLQNAVPYMPLCLLHQLLQVHGKLDKYSFAKSTMPDKQYESCVLYCISD